MLPNDIDRHGCRQGAGRSNGARGDPGQQHSRHEERRHELTRPVPGGPEVESELAHIPAENFCCVHHQVETAAGHDGDAEIGRHREAAVQCCACPETAHGQSADVAQPGPAEAGGYRLQQRADHLLAALTPIVGRVDAQQPATAALQRGHADCLARISVLACHHASWPGAASRVGYGAPTAAAAARRPATRPRQRPTRTEASPR